jgi:hypothetical protein
MNKNRQWVPFILAALLILGGFAIRMLDLTDPPLDYHPSRQLFSYTIARGLYYQMAPDTDPDLRAKAIAAGEATDRYEPRIQEGIVAFLYLITGGERFWIARIWTSLAWMIGGVVLFILAARISSDYGALFSLGYFLFLPFGIQASRSFQPDVLMTVALVVTAYFFYEWSNDCSWRWSLLAGSIGSISVLLKAQGIFAVTFIAILTTLMTMKIKDVIRNPQVWVMAGVMTIIPGVYYLGPWVVGGGAYFRNFTIAMSRLLSDPGFFVWWANFIHGFMDMGVIVLALIGTMIMRDKGKPISLGLWIGYLMLGLFFPWQIWTHDYYSLTLIPTVAIGLAPIGERLVNGASKQSPIWRVGFFVICLAAIAYPAWTARSALLGKDYRNESTAWKNMGEELPDDGKIIALTHDYGWRLQYWGYIPVSLWPYNADNELHIARGGNFGTDFKAYFEDLTESYDYFLVTAYSELNAQPELKELLETEYPVVQRGNGYVLYSLLE